MIVTFFCLFCLSYSLCTDNLLLIMQTYLIMGGPEVPYRVSPVPSLLLLLPFLSSNLSCRGKLVDKRKQQKQKLHTFSCFLGQKHHGQRRHRMSPSIWSENRRGTERERQEEKNARGEKTLERAPRRKLNCTWGANSIRE